ncbi:MAG: sigma-70 family RNA polymerase sigma factor [Clostridia bacterium]|nr:sigma-70 family RNA polymerase sigma factor [Clostridia bacterium]
MASQNDNTASLILAIKNGSNDAFAELLRIYLPLIRSAVSHFLGKAQKLDGDDVAQEALIALFDAANSFKFDMGVSFGAYAKVCIRNRIISCIRKSSSDMLDMSLVSSDDCDVCEIAADDMSNPENLVIDKEAFKTVLSKIGESFSPLEAKAFKLYVDGLSYKEIAKILKISEKSVDNAILRSKSKLGKIKFD